MKIKNKSLIFLNSNLKEIMEQAQLYWDNIGGKELREKMLQYAATHSKTTDKWAKYLADYDGKNTYRIYKDNSRKLLFDSDLNELSIFQKNQYYAVISLLDQIGFQYKENSYIAYDDVLDSITIKISDISEGPDPEDIKEDVLK